MYSGPCGKLIVKKPRRWKPRVRLPLMQSHCILLYTQQNIAPVSYSHTPTPKIHHPPDCICCSTHTEPNLYSLGVSFSDDKPSPFPLAQVRGAILNATSVPRLPPALHSSLPHWLSFLPFSFLVFHIPLSLFFKKPSMTQQAWRADIRQTPLFKGAFGGRFNR